jgi:cytochrome c oxidase subunit 2
MTLRARKLGRSSDHSASHFECGAVWCLLYASILLLAGCGGNQSALDPASREAKRIAHLFWWMVAGGIVIWLAVIGLALYCAPQRQAT